METASPTARTWRIRVWLARTGRQITGQFQHLDPRDPPSWPWLARLALMLGVVATIVAALWLTVLSDTIDVLRAEQEQEARLRADFTSKLPKAINLEALKRQKEQVQQQVLRLEKQLPARSEIDDLLSDVNQSGLSRNLHFELFRPGQPRVNAYYAELPIALKVTGRYHDIGAFAADIAQLSRIVTLNNLTITPTRDGALALEATAKTFRYLDPAEIEAKRKAGASAPPAPGAPAR